MQVFNYEWDQLPTTCDKLRSQLRAISQPGRENLYGEIIQIMMITKKGAEGLNLKQVRQVHIMEPYWQPVLIDQVIGRARRSKSHDKLPKSERNVEVFIYITTIIPEQIQKISHVDVRQDICKFNNDVLGKYRKVITSDEYLYIVAERKKEIINECQKLMKESAFDCALSYKYNRTVNNGLMCMDYQTDDRNDYLSTPGMDDTIERIELSQEKTKNIEYTAISIKGIMYYYNTIPDATGRIHIYDESVVNRTRTPKPVGVVVFKNGVRKFALFPAKSKAKSRSRSRSRSKSV
jgi:hypothetical protein